MTGTQLMIDRILADADAAGEAVKAEAQAKADALMACAREDISQMKAETAVQTEQQVEALLHASESAAELIRRNALLICRRELIEKTLQATVDYLCALPDREYVALLLPLLDNARQNGNGVLYLNAADLKRQGIHSLEGNGVTLSEEPLPLRGGFVLKYNELEMNCSFEALLREKHEQLEDLLNRKLFA